MPQSQNCHVLLRPFHATDIGPVNAHPLGDRFLTETGREPDSAHIQCKNLTNIHLAAMDIQQVIYCYAIYRTLRFGLRWRWAVSRLQRQEM